MPVGTIINAVAVILGSLVGLLVQKQFLKRVQDIIFDAMGLITLALAIQMALKMENFLIIAFSFLSINLFLQLLQQAFRISLLKL